MKYLQGVAKNMSNVCLVFLLASLRLFCSIFGVIFFFRTYFLLRAFSRHCFFNHSTAVNPSLIYWVQPSLVQVNEEDNVITEAGDPVKKEQELLS